MPGAPLRPGACRRPPGSFRAFSGFPSFSERSRKDLSLFLGLHVGFGSGFRVFWLPSTAPAWRVPNFQATSWKGWGLLGFGAPLRPAGASRGPAGSLRAPAGCLRAPPGGLGGISETLTFFLCLDVGFGSGFRVFWPPSTTPCLADPKFQHFPGHLLETAGQWAPRATPPSPSRPRLLGLGLLNNNLVNHRKGERSPRRGSCPSTWRCSSRSTSLFRLA